MEHPIFIYRAFCTEIYKNANKFYCPRQWSDLHETLCVLSSSHIKHYQSCNDDSVNDFFFYSSYFAYPFILRVIILVCVCVVNANVFFFQYICSLFYTHSHADVRIIIQVCFYINLINVVYSALPWLICTTRRYIIFIRLINARASAVFCDIRYTRNYVRWETHRW